MGLIDIHVTDRQTWRDCRQKYHWSNIARVAPITNKVWFKFGTLGHEALAKQNQSKGRVKAYEYAEEQWKNHLDREEGTMLVRLLAYMNKETPTDYRNLETETVEQQFTLPLPELGVNLIMTMDWVYRELGSTKRVGVDYKFVSSFPRESVIHFMDQGTCYLWAMRRLGMPLDHIKFIYVKKVQPGVIETTKDDKPTTDKVKLTYVGRRQYQEHIKLMDLMKESKYQATISHLENRPDNLIKVIPCMRTDKQLDIFEEHLFTELRDMVQNQSNVYPNFSSECSRCSYYPLCRVKYSGGDWAKFAETTYRLKEVGER